MLFLFFLFYFLLEDFLLRIYFDCHAPKHLIDVVSRFARYFEKLHLVLFGKLFSFLVLYFSNLPQVWLQSHKNLNDIYRGVTLDIFDPKLARFKAFVISNIVADESSIGFSIVHPSDLTKPLLAGCIPHEHSYLLSRHGVSADKTTRQVISSLCVYVNCFDFEVPTECGLRTVFCKRFLDISLNQRSFACHWLAHTNDLKLL